MWGDTYSWLEGIRQTAVSIVACGGGVAGSVTLTTRLDPYEGIDPGAASVGCGTATETSTDGVAPVTPFKLAGGLLARTALIHNELDTGPPLGDEQGAQSLNVLLLVEDRVGCSVRRSTGQAPRVVVGNVSGKTSKGLGLASIEVDFAEDIGSASLVSGPAEPACVASIHVHGHVGEVQGLDSVDDAAVVNLGSALALGHTQVGDHVGQGVRLYVGVSTLVLAAHQIRGCLIIPMIRMVRMSEYLTMRALIASM